MSTFELNLSKIKQALRSKAFKQILRILLGVVAVYIITRKVDVKEAWMYMRNADSVFLALAFLSFFISRWFAAFRINSLYKTQGLVLQQALNVKLYFLGMFYNLFIPLIGGEGYKAIWLKKKFNVNYKKLVGAAFLDRLSGLAILAALSLIYLTMSSLELNIDKRLAFLVVPVVLLGHFLFIKLAFKSYLPSWTISTVYSVVIQLLQIVTTYFIIKALGHDEQMVDYLFVFLLSSFAFVLPMIGAREMAYVFGAEYLGLNMELSLAISLIFYLCTAGNSILGVYYLLFPKKLENGLIPNSSFYSSNDL